MTIEEAAKWYEFCRINGIRRLRTADIEVELEALPPVDEPAAPAAPPATQKVNQDTGLTDDEEREWGIRA